MAELKDYLNNNRTKTTTIAKSIVEAHAEIAEVKTSTEEQLEELRARNEMLEECLIELANIIYA